MKKIIISLLALMLTASIAAALESPWEKKLPFKEATIDYTISGNSNGTKTIYVKDYGRTVAEYRNTSMTIFGMTQKENTLDVTTPEWEYSINLTEHTGTKMVNPEKYLIEEFQKLSKSDQKKIIKNTEEIGMNTVDGMEGEITKNDIKILGYMCDKTSMMGVTVYTISGTPVPLKLESDMMGMKMNETATSIKKGSVSSSKFDIPSGINIQHDKQSDQMAKMQAQNMIQSLLKGEMPSVSMGQGQYGDDSPEGYQDQGQESMSPEQIEQMKQMMQMFGGQKE
jgi:hypothetical protein